MLIDNLRQTAKDLYEYFKNPLNKPHLIVDINEMRQQYKAPLDSWIVGVFYQYFRLRIIDIDIIISKLIDTDTLTDWIDHLIKFFQNGEWRSTSANTVFLLKCIQKLPGYTEQDGIEFSSNKSMMIRLNKLLMEYAEKIREERRIDNMHLSNLTLVQILKNEFYDEKTKEICHRSINKLRSRGLITRVFDEFPFSIVSNDELTDLINKFNNLLIQITTYDEMILLCDEDRKNIIQLESQIIIMGCNYLLDSTGLVKQELLALLGWDNQFTSKEIVGLICAYVGKVNQLIMTSSKNLIDQHSNAFVSLCDLVNKNYSDWVIESLKKLGYVMPTKEEKLTYWATGMGLLISAATVSSYFFFRKYSLPTDCEVKSDTAQIKVVHSP
jgi:hypothetical protein